MVSTPHLHVSRLRLTVSSVSVVHHLGPEVGSNRVRTHQVARMEQRCHHYLSVFFFGMTLETTLNF